MEGPPVNHSPKTPLGFFSSVWNKQESIASKARLRISENRLRSISPSSSSSLVRDLYGLPIHDSQDVFENWFANEFLPKERELEDVFLSDVHGRGGTLESPFPINVRAHMWRLLMAGNDGCLLYNALPIGTVLFLFLFLFFF